MTFGINITRDNYFKVVSNFTHPHAREITYDNFEISPMVFMPNITTNHAITYTKQNIFPENSGNVLEREKLK